MAIIEVIAFLGVLFGVVIRIATPYIRGYLDDIEPIRQKQWQLLLIEMVLTVIFAFPIAAWLFLQMEIPLLSEFGVFLFAITFGYAGYNLTSELLKRYVAPLERWWSVIDSVL